MTLSRSTPTHGPEVAKREVAERAVSAEDHLRQLLLQAIAAMEPAANSPDRKGRLRHELLVRR
jgi:hypothetical protein